MTTALNRLYDAIYGGIGTARLEKMGEKERLKKLIAGAAIRRIRFLHLDSTNEAFAAALVIEVANELQSLVQGIAEVDNHLVLTLFTPSR